MTNVVTAGRFGRLARRAGTALTAMTLAALATSGYAAAQAPTTEVTGSGTISYNGELTRFSVDITRSGDSVNGSCSFQGERGTTVQCTSLYDFQTAGSKAVSVRGTALFNGRPISFTAKLTDGGTGPQDTYILYAAGRNIGGTLISGDVSITTTGEAVTTSGS